MILPAIKSTTGAKCFQLFNSHFYLRCILLSEQFFKISLMLSRAFQLYSPLSTQELGGGADTDKKIQSFSQKNKKDEKGVISKSWTRVSGEKLVVSSKHEGEYQVAKPAVKRPDKFFTLSSLANIFGCLFELKSIWMSHSAREYRCEEI